LAADDDEYTSSFDPATFLIATRRGEYFMVMVPMATVVLMAMVETRVVATMMALMNAVATGHDQGLE
jgi:hypothetical protein